MVDLAPPRWGSELRTTFNLLSDEVVTAGECWGSYRSLVPSEEAANLLRSIANEFFVLVQYTLAHSVILSLGRLCDPPGTPGHDNLSFPRLFKLIDGALDRGIVAEAERKWEALSATRESVRALRNKRLAHNDLKVVSGETTTGNLIVRDVGALLDGMRSILETLAEREGAEIMLKTGREGEGATQLLRTLQRAARAHVAGHHGKIGGDKSP